MTVTQTDIPGVLLIKPNIFRDDRGAFLESFSARRYKEHGIAQDWVQDNLSTSVKGVIRGLHFQRPPFAQAKIVQVIRGRILDVVVDIRTGSPTFGKHVAVELDSEDRMQILVPHGFAHGFSVLSPFADVLYKTDNYYSKDHEAGLRFDDPALAIDWRIPPGEAILSPKDLELTFLKDLSSDFEYQS
jgi:dTDP-4-dehydrorhamnose 3,5-epimerase